MSQNSELTIDQKLQIARMATDIYLQVFPNGGVSPYIKVDNALENPEHMQPELAKAQLCFDWAYDLITTKIRKV